MLFLSLTSCASPRDDIWTEAEVFQEVFRRIDGDGNGRIDRTEYARVDYQDGYSEIDRDADGAIVLAELTAWVKLTQPRPQDRAPLLPAPAPGQERTRPGGPDGGPDGGPPGGAPGGMSGPPLRTDIPDDPKRVQIHIVDLERLGGSSPFAVTLNGFGPLDVRDDGNMPDFRADDGVYTLLVDRPAIAEAELKVQSPAMTWSGTVSLARGTSVRPVALKLNDDGTLSIAGGGPQRAPMPGRR